MLDEARKVDADGDEFVEFAVTGMTVAGEFHCSECGYGITVHSALPQCPMCAGTTWEQASWTPAPRMKLQ